LQRFLVRVLVVEDEIELAELMARGLREQGMAVDICFDGADALYQTSINRYDVVVLDRGLPGIHGDEVCQRLGVTDQRPRVIMCTASTTESEELEGLALGADDYLAKPFSFPMLVARVRALGRRSGSYRPPVLKHGDLLLDSTRRYATRGGVPLTLARKELAVLEALLEADGAVVSAEQLLERVWDDGIDPFTNAVRVTIMRLRQKLGEPALIETVSGEGYRL
jgi:DNA-binding response OmpR family regulator